MSQSPSSYHGRPRTRGGTAAEPVSVVMPVRNEELTLAESVRSVLGQDYPGELEVVLAVGPSRDRTARGGPVAGRRPTRGSRWCPTRPGTSRRRSTRRSRCRGTRSWPGSTGTRCSRRATCAPRSPNCAQTGADNVGGIMAAEGVTPFQQAVAWAMTSPFGVGAAKFHTGGLPGPGRHRVPGRVPPGRDRAGGRLRRDLPAGRGLGAQPPDPAGRGADLVPAGPAGHLPAPGERGARSPRSTSTTAGGAG